MSVLKRIRHPNVVALLDLCRRQDRLFLILEFCSAGDLSQLIRTRGPLPEKEALYFFQQLAAGLRALREADLIHRDLKPQNLLLASKHDQLQLKVRPEAPAPAAGCGETSACGRGVECQATQGRARVQRGAEHALDCRVCRLLISASSGSCRARPWPTRCVGRHCTWHQRSW